MNDKNYNNVKRICGLAMLAALAVIAVGICHFPIIPALSFLEYDLGDVFIFLAGFMFGPVHGFIITVAVSLIQAFAFGGNGIIGAVMHIIPTGLFVLTSGFIYRKLKTKKGALIALSAGLAVWLAAIIPVNIFITPGFMGVERSVVISMLPLILLFNFIKAGLNSVLTFLLYKRVKWVFMRIFHESAETEDKFIASKGDLEYNNKMEKVITRSEQETMEYAAKLALKLRAGDVITLSGDLGAGKTVFAKGIAEGLGITDRVVSPTFTLANIYGGGRLVMNHFDMYRLENSEEAYGAGLADIIDSDGVSVIEWSERAAELIPEKRMEVFIKYIDENTREITVEDKR